MAYELELIKQSQQIFYVLLQQHALSEEKEPMLFKRYIEQEELQQLLTYQADAANCTIERYGSVIYLIPALQNDFLGYSKKQLKTKLCKSNGTDKDYYLSQFVVITLLVAFYDGQGSSSKSRNFIRVGELLNLIAQRLAEGARREEEQKTSAADDILAFADMQEAFEALRSEEGSRARTTKEGFLYTILSFLDEQGLILYVDKEEMIYTTEKLDRFMDYNLLNKNNFNRVLQVLGVQEDE